MVRGRVDFEGSGAVQGRRVSRIDVFGKAGAGVGKYEGTAEQRHAGSMPSNSTWALGNAIKRNSTTNRDMLARGALSPSSHGKWTVRNWVRYLV